MGAKKKPGNREGACVAQTIMCGTNFKEIECYVLQILLDVLELCGDKMKFIGEKAVAV